jgi:hypothetical protein
LEFAVSPQPSSYIYIYGGEKVLEK